MAQSTIVSRIVASIGGVHRSASGDPLVASRHESFITTHLIGGLLALACLAVYLASATRADAVAAAALVWLAVPAALSAMLARTGRLALAHVLSAAHHAILVLFVAGLTGGVGSFVLPWIVVVPIEAALSGSRRVIHAALALALASLAALAALEFAGALPRAHPIAIDAPVLRVVGLVSAGLYAGLLAMAVQALARESENAAREGARRYRLMAENATDLISVHDVEGNAHFVSPGARRLLAHDPADLMDGGFLDAVSVGERPAFLRAVAEAGHNGGETALAYRLSSGAASRAPVWVETRCRPLAAPGTGERGRVVAVTRDITEARAREDELRRTRDEAEEANRAKSRFLANISHELRTPLNAILGFSDVLAQGMQGSDTANRQAEFVGLISESGTHLLNIVNDLLDMSKIEAGRYEIARAEVALAELLRSCVDIMGPAAAAARVEIAVDLADPPPALHADQRALRQIVLNLLSNAVKFSDAGATVSVGARAAGENVELFVADHGIGMAPEDLRRIGEPFFQADGGYDRTYEGTGLGLSVVKGLVGLHGGHLALDSTPGRGTTVTVSLPAGEAGEAGREGREKSMAHG